MLSLMYPCRNQIEQLAEVRARRAAQREAEAIEGQQILARAKGEVEEDRQKAEERKNWHRQNNLGEKKPKKDKKEGMMKIYTHGPFSYAYSHDTGK